MSSVKNRAVFTICVIAAISSATGFQWTSLKIGDPIPENAVKFNENEATYVGRARHYNLIMPATVTKKGATIFYYKDILKTEYEVLTANEHCEWIQNGKIKENIVRAGSAWNHEPIFIAKSRPRRGSYKVVSIYLTSDKTEYWPDMWESTSTLICDDVNIWIDASSKNLSNTIYRSASTYENAGVARLIGPASSTVAAKLTLDNGIATCNYLGVLLKSSYYQALIGTSLEYSWIQCNKGVIPDFAVVAGKTDKNELIYVGRINAEVAPITFSKALDIEDYEILVKNVL